MRIFDLRIESSQPLLYFNCLIDEYVWKIRACLFAQTIAFWKDHSVARLIHLLASLIPLTSSAVFCSIILSSLAQSVYELGHSLSSLPCGTIEIHEYVFTLWTRFTGTNTFWVVSRNTPREGNADLFWQSVMVKLILLPCGGDNKDLICINHAKYQFLLVTFPSHQLGVTELSQPINE